jgi:nucleoside-diphosphate-sugar epimerase
MLRAVSSPSTAAARRPSVKANAGGLKVAVTGAGGRTGKLVLKRLLQRQDESPELVRSVVGTVRSGSSALALKSDLPELAVAANSVAVVDVAALGRAAESGANPLEADAELKAALDGADALVIVTSGVPQIKKRSLVWVMIAKLIGKQGVRPSFRWKAGEEPKTVDWWGQKAQIDAAIAAGVKRVVVVSSMGGTDPKNMLNSIADGNILQWKRKAEQYLVAKAAEGKVEYVILHPGGLVDTAALKRPLVLGVDDTLLKRKRRSIPRDDVARVCVAAVGAGGPGVKDASAAAAAFKNKALDLVCDAKEGEDGEDAEDEAGARAQDLAALAAAVGKYDYSINSCAEF